MSQSANQHKVMDKKVTLVKDKQGGFSVNIDGVNFGSFDQLDLNGLFCFFPKRTDRLTGDHYIEMQTKAYI